MAFNTLTELNLYSQGVLAFTNDVVTTIPEGTKVALPQPTWEWVKSTGNILGNNITFTHETIDTLSGNVTISFDDYNAATMNTNIVNTAGNISINGLNDAEDWVGATLYLDVPADYYGNIEFTSTVTNTDSNVSLQWSQSVIWTNEPELDTPSTIFYKWYDEYQSQFSISFWLYNDMASPTSSSISSYPITMRKHPNVNPGDPDYTVTANNWTEVVDYYEDGYFYEGFDVILFDTRDPSYSRWNSNNDYKTYFIINNGPDWNDGVYDYSGVNARLAYDIASGNQVIETEIDRGGMAYDPTPGQSTAVGEAIFQRDLWRHFTMTFNPNLLDASDQLGTIRFLHNGVNFGDEQFDGLLGPKFTIGRNAISGTQYFTGYIEDFCVRNRSDTSFYTPDWSINDDQYYDEFNNGELITIEPSEGDVLLLNTNDVTDLTLNDNPTENRGAVSISATNISAYTTSEVENLASIYFNGSAYIYASDIGETLNSPSLGGTTQMWKDYVALVRDDENSGTYTLNINTNQANLIVEMASSLDGVSLTSFSGNDTSNVSLVGSREDINAHLKTAYLTRNGDIPLSDRAGNITWTLTPPGGRAVTVINQQRTPLYNTSVTSLDRLLVPAASTHQLDTLAYAGVDGNANPVFAYAWQDDQLFGGGLAMTTLKIDYSTADITYGSVTIINTPDDIAGGGGRLHLLGPRDNLNTGNTVNDGSDLIITATQDGGGNLYQGNVTISTTTQTVQDYSLSTVTDTSNDGTDLLYIAQIPQGVANSWSEGPWNYEKYDHPVATFPYYNIDLTQNRQDETTVYSLSDITFDVYNSTPNPREWYRWQPLDLWSTNQGGKVKAVQAKKVWSYGGVDADEVDIELTALIGNKLEDDSDANTEYETNIETVTSDRFFSTPTENRAYRFNDTETDQYLKITNDDFYRLEPPSVTTVTTGTLVDGGDYLQFNSDQVAITWDEFYVGTNADFQIDIDFWMDSNVNGERCLITNSSTNNNSIGSDEFSLVQYQYLIGGSTYSLPRIRFHLEGKSYSATPSANQLIESQALSLNTWYSLTLKRQSGIVTLTVNGTTASDTIDNNTNLGNSSDKTFRIGMFGINTYIDPWAGRLKNFSYQYNGNPSISSSLDDVNIPITTYQADTDFLVEAFIKFYDRTADQYILSNMEDPSATLTATDFRVSLDDSTGQLVLDTYNGSGTGGSIVYEDWYHIAVQRTQALWEVFINGSRAFSLNEYNAIGSSSQTSLYWGDFTNTTNRLNATIDSLRVGSEARFTSDNFIPTWPNQATSPVGAYIDTGGALDDYPTNHWDTVTVANTITSTELTSIGYDPKFGNTYTFDRAYFGDCVSSYALVYGGSDSRAYLIYTKAVYTDATENYVLQSPQKSVGLFYRKVTINDDLTLSLGSEVEIVNASTGPTFGQEIAADSIRLGSNMFINIVIGDGDQPTVKSYVYALKFAYS